MITEQQSSGYDIRDAFYNVVTVDPFFAGFTFRKNRMLPVQQDLIPYLGVYLVDEMMVPDGDANAGCVRFLHTVRIGFSIVVANSNTNVCEQTADQGFMRVMASAYCNLNLMNVLTNSNPEGVGIEAITRGMRRAIHGASSTDNETPFIEMQYEASATFRSEWYPDITDTLNEIVVTTGVKPGDTQTEMDQRQQVEWAWDFTNAAPPTTKPTMLRREPLRRPLKRPWLSARDQNRRI
jgi:hypothetical protein